MPDLPMLDLPDHGVKTNRADGGATVFDPVRRKWVALTPEEWVRQHFLQYLVHELGCPASLVKVECLLTLNGLTKRADLLVHDRAGAPLALVECKAPEVKLVQGVFDQAARYNLSFKVRWLMITNGLQHYCCEVDHAKGSVRFLDRLLPYEEMLG